jgi:hypothetical protein
MRIGVSDSDKHANRLTVPAFATGDKLVHPHKRQQGWWRTIIRTGDPALRVGDSVDEFDVSRALRVAITRSVLGSGLVGSVGLGNTTVGVHLRKVESAVETAGEL